MRSIPVKLGAFLVLRISTTCYAEWKIDIVEIRDGKKIRRRRKRRWLIVTDKQLNSFGQGQDDIGKEETK